jgi:hypothetical protein
LRGGGDGIRGRALRPAPAQGHERREFARIDGKAVAEISDGERTRLRFECEPQLTALEHRA